MLNIREATADDAKLIRRLVRQEHLDPTSLQWRHFLIAEIDGETVGIGQVKVYPGCRELGSLVVREDYRKQGIAARLIAELEARNPPPLYLLCAARLQPFYQQFGYRAVSWWRAPAMLKLKTAFVMPFRVFGVRVAIMVKASPESQDA